MLYNREKLALGQIYEDFNKIPGKGDLLEFYNGDKLFIQKKYR
jgi:hypothetical protein